MELKTGLLNKDYPVLVVDDEPMVLSVLAKMLGKLGYPVETALGSEEAIGRLTGAAYPIVITDFNMPTLNGQQLAGWIKQHHPHTKVVIMTGCSSDVASRLRTGGDIDAVMFKPIELKELRDVISGLNLSRAFHPGSVSPSISLKTHPDSISSGPLSGSNPDHPRVTWRSK
jgi:CheY-like chemotaxis protein